MVGVLKAYSTCVGAGPFVAEKAMNGEWTEMVRKYGANMVLPLEDHVVWVHLMPLQPLCAKMPHADKIALTKLDVLSNHGSDS